MPWLRFTARFDWWTVPTLQFKRFTPGTVALVPAPCAAAAMAAGAAVKTVKPKAQGDAHESRTAS